MRLSDVLSKEPQEYVQIEGFLFGKRLKAGRQQKLDVGKIVLPYHCNACNNDMSFLSEDKLYCIGVNDHLVSIDCVLKCPRCNALVEEWFLVESEDEIFNASPNVRILKRVDKMSENVYYPFSNNPYALFFEKAERAYREKLGAGAIIYLRKIYEEITLKVAIAKGFSIHKANGSVRPFKDILEEVDEQNSIIPREFSENGYRLFKELSEIIHSKNDAISEEKEAIALQKYEPLKRLVKGVIDNVQNHADLQAAVVALNWGEENNDQD